MDIDLLFAALARPAGMDARVASLPDRSKRFLDPNVVMPGLSVLDDCGAQRRNLEVL